MFIEQAWSELIKTLARHGEPESVCDVLQRQLVELRRGEVDPRGLVIVNRVSKGLDEYSQYTWNVAALERAADNGIKKHAGEYVSYVVVDDSKAVAGSSGLDVRESRGVRSRVLC